MGSAFVKLYVEHTVGFMCMFRAGWLEAMHEEWGRNLIVDRNDILDLITVWMLFMIIMQLQVVMQLWLNTFYKKSTMYARKNLLMALPYSIWVLSTTPPPRKRRQTWDPMARIGLAKPPIWPTGQLWRMWWWTSILDKVLQVVFCFFCFFPIDAGLPYTLIISWV